MPKHLSTRQVSELLARRLPPDELSGAMGHLAACDACRARVSSDFDCEGQLAALRAQIKVEAGEGEGHLTYERLSGFVDRTLNAGARAIISSHLEVCDDCAAEVHEMESLLSTAPLTAVRAAKHPPRQKRAWSRKAAFLPLSLATAAVLFAGMILFSAWHHSQQGQRPGRLSTASPISNETILGTTRVQSQPSPATNAAAPIPQDNRAAFDSRDSRQNDLLKSLSDLPAAYQQMVRKVVAEQRAPVSPAVAEVTAPKGVLRGGQEQAESFALLSPAGKVLQSDRPTFKWEKLPGAQSHSVVVLDQMLNVVASGKTTEATSWRPSEPLPRDQVLRWQVTAYTSGGQVLSPAPPSPEAKFKILPQAKVTELHHAAKKYPGDHLLLGSLYSEAGLMDEAVREFRSLLAEEPQSEVARKLRRRALAGKKVN